LGALLGVLREPGRRNWKPRHDRSPGASSEGGDVSSVHSGIRELFTAKSERSSKCDPDLLPYGARGE
jgi:hypothetical protein